MPKVEASFVEASALGGRMVPIEDLDRANAEIERLEERIRFLTGGTVTLIPGKDAVQLKRNPDGTVTEVDRG